MTARIKGGVIQKIALAYMIVWAISPPLSYGNLYRVLFVFCFVIWDCCAINRCGSRFLTKQMSLFLFLATIVGISVLADGIPGLTRNLQFILFMLFLPVFYYYFSFSREDTAWILILILMLVIIWDFTTLRAYSTTRNASRLLAKDFEGAEYYSRQGVGGYGYVYFLVFIIPMMLGAILRERKKFNLMLNALLAIALVMSVLVVLRAGYAIALILMCISVFFVLFIRKIKNPLLLAIFCGIVFFLVYLNLDRILMLIRGYSANTMYARKIDDMLLSLNTGEAVGNVYGRFERYTRSIRLFLQSPIWGQLTFRDIGKHSAILDRFAQYGVFVGTWALYYFTLAQRAVYKLHIDDGMAFSIMITSVLYFTLNNVAYAQAAGLFVFYIAMINKLRYTSKTKG